MKIENKTPIWGYVVSIPNPLKGLVFRRLHQDMVKNE